jgi:regulator of sigma E protease
MDSLLFTVAAFIVALGVLITVHEFGHFWVARRLGVKVLRFSVGFGRPLWRRVGRADETEYVVAAIPLGGYVKMLDEREGPVAETELPRAFNRQRLGVRGAIVAAGPAFNFLFAILAFWLVFVVGDTGTRPWVGEVVPNTPAAVAGFEPGDEILAIDGEPTPTWEVALYQLLEASMDARPVMVRVRDLDGLERSRPLPGDVVAGIAEDGDADVLGKLGLKPKRPAGPAVIGVVVPGESAEASGLEVGDRILEADGQPVESWERWVDWIREHPDSTRPLLIEREGRRIELILRIGSKDEDGERIGRIGAGGGSLEELPPEYRALYRLGPVDALGAAIEKSWDTSVLTLQMLGKILIGAASVKNLGGPLSIAQIAGKSASYGAIDFLKFLAFVSVSLGVLNLLPIPVLDGGHLLFFLVEAVKGSPVSEAAQMQAQRVGIAILLALMTLAFYVDLSRLLG